LRKRTEFFSEISDELSEEKKTVDVF